MKVRHTKDQYFQFLWNKSIDVDDLHNLINKTECKSFTIPITDNEVLTIINYANHLVIQMFTIHLQSWVIKLVLKNGIDLTTGLGRNRFRYYKNNN